jgi:PAS domain S-box-containing protein
VKEKELYIAIETALQRYEREQLMLTVFKSMGDGVIVTDCQMQVKSLNPMAERLTGWSQATAKNQLLNVVFNITDIQTQQPIIDQLAAAALQQDLPIYLDTPVGLTAQTGTQIPIVDSITAIRDSKGSSIGVVIVFRDFTQGLLAKERNLAIEQARQLEIQLAELQRLNQLKEDFLATVSHELRTPLSNIDSTIHLLESVLSQRGAFSPNDASDPLTRYLNVLNQQCQQELRLVNDLLEMRAIDADLVPLELISIQVQDWVPHILEGFEDRIQQQQQHLQLSIAANLPALTTELSSFTRIISELIHNACKYTDRGEQIVIAVEAIESTQTPFPFLQISISNSGAEIPPTELSRIFDPFYRIPNRDPWRYGGTGLGLALTQKLMKRLQGRIEVTSEQNWTTFKVQFPQNPTSP